MASEYIVRWIQLCLKFGRNIDEAGHESCAILLDVGDLHDERAPLSNNTPKAGERCTSEEDRRQVGRMEETRGRKDGKRGPVRESRNLMCEEEKQHSRWKNAA